MTVWKDIDINLKKAQNGDIRWMSDVDAIMNSLSNILTTLQGQRRMLPEFALPLWELLFEPIDETTATLIGEEMLKAINIWDDRITVSNVNVWPVPDENKYEVTLTFNIKSTKSAQRLTVILFAR